MEGEEERSENEGSFSKASIPKRIAIFIAGATVNIIFGFFSLFFPYSWSKSYCKFIYFNFAKFCY